MIVNNLPTVHHVEMETLCTSTGAAEPRRIGVVTPYDFAQDRELWRWVPELVDLHLTRTPYQPLPVSLDQAELVGAPQVVAQCTVDLSAISPHVVAYACTSGSFVGGLAGQEEILSGVLATGVPAAVTTSGAILQALAALDIHRVAVATPYDDIIAGTLASFLSEAGLQITGVRSLGRTSRIWEVDQRTTAELIRQSARTGGEAVVVSCTNLATYDVIAPLEAELGIPVLTANQVTMWAALRAIDACAVGLDQHLVRHGEEVAA